MIRRVLVVVGTVAAGYGAWLLSPQFWDALPWLAGGPLLHDLLVAPIVGAAGMLVGRRRVLGAGLAITGTLLLIAVPLIWRPHPGPPNPGLLNRDYGTGLVVFLGPAWVLVALATLLRRRRDRRRGGS